MVGGRATAEKRLFWARWAHRTERERARERERERQRQRESRERERERESRERETRQGSLPVRPSREGRLQKQSGGLNTTRRGAVFTGLRWAHRSKRERERERERETVPGAPSSL